MIIYEKWNYPVSVDTFDRILDVVNAFRGEADQEDDMTCVVVRVEDEGDFIGRSDSRIFTVAKRFHIGLHCNPNLI